MPDDDIKLLVHDHDQVIQAYERVVIPGIRQDIDKITTCINGNNGSMGMKTRLAINEKAILDLHQALREYGISLDKTITNTIHTSLFWVRILLYCIMLLVTVAIASNGFLYQMVTDHVQASITYPQPTNHYKAKELP